MQLDYCEDAGSDSYIVIDSFHYPLSSAIVAKSTAIFPDRNIIFVIFSKYIAYVINIYLVVKWHIFEKVYTYSTRNQDKSFLVIMTNVILKILISKCLIK